MLPLTIAVSGPRTGSNFIKSLLSSHSETIVHAELMKKGGISFRSQVYRDYNLKEMLKERASNPVKFIEKYVFKPYPEYINAVGFKAFYAKIDE